MEPRFDISNTALNAPVNEPGSSPVNDPVGAPALEPAAEPRSAARIRGVPVYRLTGVSDANRDLVKSTQMWVHYRHLGDEGWYLAVPDAWREAAAKGLGRHGLGLAYAGKLPERSNAMFYLGVAAFSLVAFAAGVIVVGETNSDFGLVLALAGIAAPFVAAHQRGKSGAQYGSLLALTEGRGGGASSTGGNLFESFHQRHGGSGFAHIPGTMAYDVYGGWRND